MGENVERNSLLEIEIGDIRFKAEGRPEFITEKLEYFLDNVVEKLKQVKASKATSPATVLVGTQKKESPNGEEGPEWAVKIAADSGINIGYIQPFFRMHRDILVPHQWRKCGTNKTDGPNIAHVLLYANKTGLGIKEISGRKMIDVLRSLGVGDIENQSTHIKAQPGIIGGKGMYRINPAGETTAKTVLAEQMPK